MGATFFARRLGAGAHHRLLVRGILVIEIHVASSRRTCAKAKKWEPGVAVAPCGEPLVDHVGDEAAEFVVRQYLRSAILLLRLPAGRERQAELGAPCGAVLV